MLLMGGGQANNERRYIVGQFSSSIIDSDWVEQYHYDGLTATVNRTLYQMFVAKIFLTFGNSGHLIDPTELILLITAMTALEKCDTSFWGTVPGVDDPTTVIRLPGCPPRTHARILKMLKQVVLWYGSIERCTHKEELERRKYATSPDLALITQLNEEVCMARVFEEASVLVLTKNYIHMCLGNEELCRPNCGSIPPAAIAKFCGVDRPISYLTLFSICNAEQFLEAISLKYPSLDYCTDPDEIENYFTIIVCSKLIERVKENIANMISNVSYCEEMLNMFYRRIRCPTPLTNFSKMYFPKNTDCNKLCSYLPSVFHLPPEEFEGLCSGLAKKFNTSIQVTPWAFLDGNKNHLSGHGLFPMLISYGRMFEICRMFNITSTVLPYPYFCCYNTLTVQQNLAAKNPLKKHGTGLLVHIFQGDSQHCRVSIQWKGEIILWSRILDVCNLLENNHHILHLPWVCYLTNLYIERNRTLEYQAAASMKRFMYNSPNSKIPWGLPRFLKEKFFDF